MRMSYIYFYIIKYSGLHVGSCMIELSQINILSIWSYKRDIINKEWPLIQINYNCVESTNNTILQYSQASTSPPHTMTELQQILSSDQQCDDSQLQFNSSPNSKTVQKQHSLKQIMFNLKYNLMHSNFVSIPYLHRPKIVVDQDSEPAFLMGCGYQYSTRNKFAEHFQSIVWMSYRSSSANGKSDVGWGCMIRVIQMVFAQILKRQNPIISTLQIIQLFKSGKNNIFSLENICEEGKIKQRWTGCNQIVLAISSIINNLKCGRLPKTSLLEKFNFGFQIQLYNEHISIQNFQRPNFQKQFPKLVVISNKIVEEGCTSFPAIYADHAKHLMRMPEFCGMIGGVSNQALFIVGFQDDKAIILDPHYVQEEDSSETVRYFKKNPRGISFNELCQSYSFCFYIKDVDSYKNWAAELCYSVKLYDPYLVIGLQVMDPEDMIEKHRKRSQDFQML